MGSNLGAIAWFFERPYETPAAILTLPDRAWIVGEASLYLQAQGRLQEALSTMRAALRMVEEVQD